MLLLYGGVVGRRGGSPAGSVAWRGLRIWTVLLFARVRCTSGAVLCCALISAASDSRVHRQVCPPPMPAWPLWMRDLWQGWPGSAYGADGHRRAVARKFAVYLNNGLSLASQVQNATCISDLRGGP